MHLANSGRVIVKLTKQINEGQLLFDEKGSKVAKIMEIIGPIAKPYASATPLTNSIKKCTGKKVFVTNITAREKQRRKHR